MHTAVVAVWSEPSAIMHAMIGSASARSTRSTHAQRMCPMDMMLAIGWHLDRVHLSSSSWRRCVDNFENYGNGQRKPSAVRMSVKCNSRAIYMHVHLEMARPFGGACRIRSQQRHSWHSHFCPLAGGCTRSIAAYRCLYLSCRVLPLAHLPPSPALLLLLSPHTRSTSLAYPSIPPPSFLRLCLCLNLPVD